MVNCSYEFYTIHTDSLTEGPSGNSFVSKLFTPLKDVVQVSVLFASFDANVNASNVCYLTIDELSSKFNEITGTQTNSNIAVSAFPPERARFQHPVAIFETNEGRTVYKQNDYSTQTQFITPIRKLDRLTCNLYGQDGNLIDLNSENTFISLRITCLRENLCPKKNIS